MIEKYFDPLSKLARDASSDNPTIYIGKVGEMCEKIVEHLTNKEQENKKEENYVSR